MELPKTDDIVLINCPEHEPFLAHVYNDQGYLMYRPLPHLNNSKVPSIFLTHTYTQYITKIITKKEYPKQRNV